MIRILQQGGVAAVNLWNVISKSFPKLENRIIRMVENGGTLSEVIKLIRSGIAQISRSAREQLMTDSMKSAEYQEASTVAYLSTLTTKQIDAYNVTKKSVRKSFTIPLKSQNITVNDLFTGLFTGMSRATVNITRTAFQEGQTVKQIARNIRKNIPDSLESKTIRNKSEALARTTISQVANQTRLDTYKANDFIVDRVIFAATLDSRTSSVCQANDGLWWYLEDPSLQEPPLHVNCVPGDTLVTSSKFIKNIYRRRYKGLMVNIKTKSGVTIVITPNHPILTRTGWKAAKFIDCRDKLVLDGWSGHANNKDTVVATIGDIFRSLYVVVDSDFIRDTPTSAEDFHGDATDSKVEIVDVACFIGDDIKSIVEEHTENSSFIFGSFINTSLRRFSAFDFFVNACNSSLGSDISIFNKTGDLIGRAVIHSRLLLLRTISKIKSAVFYKPLRILYTVPSALMYSTNADSSIPKIKNFRKVEIRKPISTSRRSDRDIVFNKDSSNGFIPNAEEITDFLDSNKIDGIEFDDVVDFSLSEFNGHVHNLENNLNWYSCNGIITHNCRSTTVPVLKGESIKSVKSELRRPEVVPKSKEQYEKQGLKTRTGRIRKPSTTDRSPLERIDEKKYTNYQTWFKEQPAYYQRDILGPRAYGVFKETGDFKKAIGQSNVSQSTWKPPSTRKG
jgi:SPP1 gp7 family putative phage head morphogenesis protein